jgi:DNA modification methylase
MIKLYNDDCLKIIKGIPDKSIDLVVIDPPYDFMTKHKSSNYTGAGAFGKLGRNYHGELEKDNMIYGINEDVLKELIRVMKKINIYIWCSKEQLFKYMKFFNNYNFDLLCWHKSNPVPTCNNKYLSDTEYLLFFRENGVKIFGSYATKKKYYVTPINKEDKNKYNHPTIKPLEIIKNLIINSSEENDTILDCFMGSGTTGVACKELNRNFIGIEIDEKYFNISKERIGEENE